MNTSYQTDIPNIFLDCLLYPINVKRAKPIGLKLLMVSHLTQRKIYNRSKLKNFAEIKCQLKFFFWKFIKEFENFSLVVNSLKIVLWFVGFEYSLFWNVQESIEDSTVDSCVNALLLLGYHLQAQVALWFVSWKPTRTLHSTTRQRMEVRDTFVIFKK